MERLIADVRLTWCGDDIAVRRYQLGEVVRLGDGHGCLAAVPCASEGDWPVARVEASAVRLVVPPRATGCVERSHGGLEELGELVAARLVSGDRARVVIGDFEVEITAALGEVKARTSRRGLALLPWLHVGAAAAIHGAVLAGSGSAASAGEADAAEDAQRMQTLLARADARESKEQRAFVWRSNVVRPIDPYGGVIGEEPARGPASAWGADGQTPPKCDPIPGARRSRKGAKQGAPEGPPLSSDEIERVIRQGAERFRSCYEQGRLKNGSLRGGVTTRFVVAADGSVTEAKEESATLTDAAMRACVVGGFRTLKFPKPGRQMTVSYPWVFGDD